jgi:DNA-binding NarL/FixJ family response regulator
MHHMTDRERADPPTSLYRELLEREARLDSLMDLLLERHQRPEPSASTARQAPTVTPGDQIRLTKRDVEILRLLVLGHTNRQIGGQLHLARGSVRNCLGRIYQKLGVTTRTQAAVRALELGLIGPSTAGPPEER